MIPRLSPNIEFSQFSQNFLKFSTVAEFEKAFAELSSSRFAIAFPYGRTAILCLLKALGLHRKKKSMPSVYLCCRATRNYIQQELSNLHRQYARSVFDGF